MSQGSALLDSLEENPLPDAYEVHMVEAFRHRDRFELLARRIAGLEGVSEVEYGREWLNRFVRIIDLFRLVGIAMAGLFFLAAAFIVANTIRLVLYSRRDEIEILRLMGGAEGFIRGPFYMQGLLQGGLGGAAGMALLFVGFRFVADKVAEGGGFLPVRFLPDEMILGIFIGSMVVGWIGSYVSLRQFLKG
jgi:cell division transport system permease protein